MQVDSEISIKFPYRLDEDDDNVSSSIGSAMPFNLLTSFAKKHANVTNMMKMMPAPNFVNGCLSVIPASVMSNESAHNLSKYNAGLPKLPLP